MVQSKATWVPLLEEKRSRQYRRRTIQCALVDRDQGIEVLVFDFQVHKDKEVELCNEAGTTNFNFSAPYVLLQSRIQLVTS